MGLRRAGGALLLNPPMGTTVEEGDSLARTVAFAFANCMNVSAPTARPSQVVLAEEEGSYAPTVDAGPHRAACGAGCEEHEAPPHAAAPSPRTAAWIAEKARPERVLFVGWRRDMVRPCRTVLFCFVPSCVFSSLTPVLQLSMVQHLDELLPPGSSLTCFAAGGVAARIAALAPARLAHVTVSHFDGDAACRADLERLPLEGFTSLLILSGGGDRFDPLSSSESDAAGSAGGGGGQPKRSLERHGSMMLRGGAMFADVNASDGGGGRGGGAAGAGLGGGGGGGGGATAADSRTLACLLLIRDVQARRIAAAAAALAASSAPPANGGGASAPIKLAKSRRIASFAAAAADDDRHPFAAACARCEAVAELRDTRTRPLIADARVADCLVTSELIAKTLSMVAVNRSVAPVLASLFGADGGSCGGSGCALSLRPALSYLPESSAAHVASFWELAQLARARGELLLGWSLAGCDRPVLNPRDKGETRAWGDADMLVTLSSASRGGGA